MAPPQARPIPGQARPFRADGVTGNTIWGAGSNKLAPRTGGFDEFDAPATGPGIGNRATAVDLNYYLTIFWAGTHRRGAGPSARFPGGGILLTPYGCNQTFRATSPAGVVSRTR